MVQPAISVCLSWPSEGEFELDVDAIESVDSRIGIVTAPYRESSARRAWRARAPVAELRAEPGVVSDEYRAAIANAEVLLARDVPIGLTELAPRLTWIQSVYSGVEHFRGAGIEDGGPIITNAAGAGAASIAEFVIGRILMVWKGFREHEKLQQERTWSPAFGRSLTGSTLGVVGLGAIGTAVAARAHALGMKVRAVRQHPEKAGRPLFVDWVGGPEDLFDLLATCDVVVLSLPETVHTRAMISEEALDAMREGSVLCNIARGALVDESALIRALESGRLAAAILDVVIDEPLEIDSPLWTAPNTYISAHCSTSVDEYVSDVVDLFVENLTCYVANERLRNVVGRGSPTNGEEP